MIITQSTENSHSNKTVVQISNLNKSFRDVQAVDDISFSFCSGEVHGFIGPNGSGKTTTMRIIATLETADSGDITFDGLSCVRNPSEARRHIGFMPDFLESYPAMLVEDYIDFYARCCYLHPTERKKRVANVIEFIGLSDMLDRPVKGLSKGWKQRLNLARVVLNDPKILILDEPAAGLDPRARVELRNLTRLLARQGKAVLVSSHILNELEEMCETITIIEDGKILVSSALTDLRHVTSKQRKVAIKLIKSENGEEEQRLIRFLAETPGISQVEAVSNQVIFSYSQEAEFRAEILKKLIYANFNITDYANQTNELEDAFMTLTNSEQLYSD